MVCLEAWRLWTGQHRLVVAKQRYTFSLHPRSWAGTTSAGGLLATIPLRVTAAGLKNDRAADVGRLVPI